MRAIPFVKALLLCGAVLAGPVLAQGAASSAASGPSAPAAGGFIDAARGKAAILATTTPPRLGTAVNDDVQLPRNYAQQPPIVPHRVDSYQIDRNFNKCLDCHARGKATFTQAVPVSETHYIGRDGRKLDRVSTRRYFCLQCHVPQERAAPLVVNEFRGVSAPAARP